MTGFIRVVAIIPYGHIRATLWLAQGIPELMVAKLLGHCDLKMLAKIYDHTDIETLRLKMVKNNTGAE